MKIVLVLLVALTPACVDCGNPDWAGVPDARVMLDGAPDTLHLDTLHPDALVVDTRPPDQVVPDIKVPDQLIPDQLVPDQLIPDQFQAPDSLIPDQLVPDQLIPDQLMPDMLSPDTLSPDIGVLGGIIKGIKWVTIKAGGFMMGRPTTAYCPPGAGNTWVYVKKFEIMKYEITRYQGGGLLKATQAWTTCPNIYTCPALEVKWVQAARACNALSVYAGLEKCYSGNCWSVTNGCASKLDVTKCGYRLPTAAEFEKAYRAGTTTEWYNGAASATTCNYNKANAIAWYKWNSGDKSHPVGTKQANAWGLYDMAGNAREWLHDSCGAGGVGRMMRVGSYSSGPSSMQAGMRGCAMKLDDYWTIRETGFRCVRSL